MGGFSIVVFIHRHVNNKFLEVNLNLNSNTHLHMNPTKISLNAPKGRYNKKSKFQNCLKVKEELAFDRFAYGTICNKL